MCDALCNEKTSKLANVNIFHVTNENSSYPYSLCRMPQRRWWKRKLIRSSPMWSPVYSQNKPTYKDFNLRYSTTRWPSYYLSWWNPPNKSDKEYNILKQPTGKMPSVLITEVNLREENMPRWPIPRKDTLVSDMFHEVAWQKSTFFYFVTNAFFYHFNLFLNTCTLRGNSFCCVQDIYVCNSNYYRCFWYFHW